MKHLKIAFAIVFFCLMGSINSNLLAQSNKLQVKDGEVKCKSFTLRSNSGEYKLEVEYTYMRILSASGGEVWRFVFPDYASTMRVLDNGNFVLYNVRNEIVWQTDTAERGGSGTHLQIQNDGNLVLYNGSWYGGDGDALWATGTCGGKKDGCGTIGPR
jgi:hypothetical protein